MPRPSWAAKQARLEEGRAVLAAQRGRRVREEKCPRLSALSAAKTHPHCAATVVAVLVLERQR